MNTPQKIATIVFTVATTLIVARVLKPPTVYCELCDTETDEPRKAALDLDPDMVTEVCPDCLYAVRSAIYPVVRDIINQARNEQDRDDETQRVATHCSQSRQGVVFMNPVETDKGTLYEVQYSHHGNETRRGGIAT